MATAEEDRPVVETDADAAPSEKKKGKKGKKEKKTIGLNDFLKETPKVVKSMKSWSDTVDNEESNPVQVFDVSNLPTAPRRNDVDIDSVPKVGPFTAHIANLSFEINDDNLRNIFGELGEQIISARISKEGARSRGMGFVEFETREGLIEALKKNDKEYFGRKIRVSVSEKTQHEERGGGGFGDRMKSGGSNRTGETDRADASDNWRREPRPAPPTEDRRSARDDDRGGFDRARGGDREFSGRAEGAWNRTEPRGDRGYTRDGESGGGSGGGRDNRASDYGYGYTSRNAREGDRMGGDRGGERSGGYERPNRNRPPYEGDTRRDDNRGPERRPYTGRYSEPNRDVRDRRASDEQDAPPPSTSTQRPRLNLQPRTKPLEEIRLLSGSNSSINNVAAATTTPGARTSSPHSSTHGGDDTESVTSAPASRHADMDDQEDRTSRHEDDRTSRHEDEPHPHDAPAPSKGAGASVFGGAKPVDTAARELEIERKLKELNVSREGDDTTSTSRPPYRSSGGDRDRDRRDDFRGDRERRDDYRGDRDRRDDYRGGDRDRNRDDGGGRYNNSRSYGGGESHRREYSGGRRGETEYNGRRDDRYDDRRTGGGGGGYNRDNRDRRPDDGGPPRTSKYNYHSGSDRDTDRGSYRDSNTNGRESYGGRYSREERESGGGYPPSNRQQRDYDHSWHSGDVDQDDRQQRRRSSPHPPAPSSTSRVPAPSPFSNDHPRSSNNNSTDASSTGRNQRNSTRRNQPTEEESRLALHNKFGLLDDNAEETVPHDDDDE